VRISAHGEVDGKLLCTQGIFEPYEGLWVWGAAWSWAQGGLPPGERVATEWHGKICEEIHCVYSSVETLGTMVGSVRGGAGMAATVAG